MATRVQDHKQIGVGIAKARTKRIFSQNGLNADVNKCEKALQQCLSLTKTQDGKKVTVAPTKRLEELEPEVKTLLQKFRNDYVPSEEDAALSEVDLVHKIVRNNRYRISEKAFIALSSYLHTVGQDIINKTCETMVTKQKSIMQAHFFVENTSHSAITSFPLVSVTSAYLGAVKAATTPTPTPTQPTVTTTATDTPTPVAAEADVKVEAGDGVNNEDNFRHYIDDMCKTTISRNEAYKSFRVSEPFRQFISEILVELVQRLIPVIRTEIGSRTRNTKRPTVDDSMIIVNVKKLLQFHGRDPTEVVEFMTQKVNMHKNAASVEPEPAPANAVKSQSHAVKSTKQQPAKDVKDTSTKAVKNVKKQSTPAAPATAAPAKPRKVQEKKTSADAVPASTSEPATAATASTPVKKVSKKPISTTSA